MFPVDRIFMFSSRDWIPEDSGIADNNRIYFNVYNLELSFTGGFLCIYTASTSFLLIELILKVENKYYYLLICNRNHNDS